MDKSLTALVRLALVLIVAVVGGPRLSWAESGPRALPDTTHAIEVQARQITHFKASHSNGHIFGKLEFRGGLVLTSNDSAFGGWSGLAIDPDGQRFIAVSDEGTWLSGQIAYRGRTPVGLHQARIGPLLALRGRTLDKKRDLDAEAMTLLEGTLVHGTALVGFERNHRIGVFPVLEGQLQAPIRYLKLPPEARRMKSNSGFEAVAVLRGGPRKGSVVAFSERYPGDTSRHVGWIWIRDAAHALGLADHNGFDITDAASLDDGALLILERRFRWTEGVKMRLRRIAAADVHPGALLDGEVLLEADLSSEIDNMEGLAVHRGSEGETVVTLISDNNFNPVLQRNLLLQFTLLDASRAALSR